MSLFDNPDDSNRLSMCQWGLVMLVLQAILTFASAEAAIFCEREMSQGQGWQMFLLSSTDQLLQLRAS